MLHLVPPLVLFLAKDPQVLDYDISSVRKVMCGAAPLGVGVSREFATRSKGMLLQGGQSFLLSGGQVQVKSSASLFHLIKGNRGCQGVGPNTSLFHLIKGNRGCQGVGPNTSLFHLIKGKRGCQGVGPNISLFHLIKGKRVCQGVAPNTSLFHLIKGNRGCQGVEPNTSLFHLKVKTCVRRLNGKQKRSHV